MVKGQGHQAALLTAAFTHQVAAAVTVGTYSVLTVGTYCYVAVRRGRSPRRREALRRPQREERHIVAAPAQLV